jgi:hypothetical protein
MAMTFVKNMTFDREGMVLRVNSSHLVSNYSNPGFANPVLIESQLEEMGQWCHEYNCGTRTSYDMFKFRNEKDITAFLLKWG